MRSSASQSTLPRSTPSASSRRASGLQLRFVDARSFFSFCKFVCPFRLQGDDGRVVILSLYGDDVIEVTYARPILAIQLGLHRLVVRFFFLVLFAAYSFVLL